MLLPQRLPSTEMAYLKATEDPLRSEPVQGARLQVDPLRYALTVRIEESPPEQLTLPSLTRCPYETFGVAVLVRRRSVVGTPRNVT